jgi:hypothetical protein
VDGRLLIDAEVGGFWALLASNVLWVVWGIVTSAYALIMLQIFLAATNIRGAQKNEVASK